MKKLIILLFLALSTTLLFAAEPTVSISSPVAGVAIVAGTTVTISGTVTGDNFEYYELHYATGNLQEWILTGISIPNSTISTINGELATWVTTGLDLSTAWALRLRAQTTDGFKSIFYVRSPVDSSIPVISGSAISNRTTGINTWVKNGDALIITASISDTPALITENIWADLTTFGGSRYSAPAEWVAGVSGIATWIITVNMQASGLVSAAIYVKDFGNNLVSSSATISADMTFPEINVYLNNLKLFNGDFFDSTISINAIVSENNSIVSFSLSLYQNGILLQSASNANGANLSFNYSGLNSSAIEVVAVAQDIAGNITTKNISTLSSTSFKVLSEVMCAPNPFNPNQEISHIGYKISQPGNVKLYIHDITGKRVFSNSQSSNLGYSEFTWDGLDSSGRMVTNGLYFGVVIVDYTVGGSSKFVTKIVVLR